MNRGPIIETAAASGGDGQRIHRIVIVGGGFGGVFTACHLERLLVRRRNVQIVLISSENYFLMTPLLFEACSGTLELSHCSLPIRAFLRSTTFVEATVTGIDVDRRIVHGEVIEGEPQEFGYDQLVLAVGSMTNIQQIPGSEAALTFKTLADAVVLRNHLIDRFERADVERDAVRKRMMLTFVIVGGGLVGVELLGELTAFVDRILTYYPHIARDDVRFVLFQYEQRILPEIDPALAEYAHRRLIERRGVEIHTGTAVTQIEPGRVYTADECIESETIVLCAGVAVSPLLADVPVRKDSGGRIVVEATMRCAERPELWALGDCATIPGPDGRPYPALAQHALREARVLAENIRAALDGQALCPFEFETLGTMAALGHYDGIGRVMGVSLRGFIAWWVRRSYYLMQMPQWSRRLRIVIDWTLSLFLRPDIVKLDITREATSYLQKRAAVVQTAE